MTLLLSANVNGAFVAMTSDYRRVDVEYCRNPETGDIEVDHSKPKYILDVKDVKAHKLNNFVLLGAGGHAELAIYLVTIMTIEVKPYHDLADCKIILEDVIKRERANRQGPDYLKFLNNYDGVSVILNGFYRDGSTGHVIFSAGKETEVEEKRTQINNIGFDLIVPVKEYVRQRQELFEIPELNSLTLQDSATKLFEIITNHMHFVQTVISYHHQLEISPDYEIHVITLNKGLYEYNRKMCDASKLHKIFLEREANIT